MYILLNFAFRRTTLDLFKKHECTRKNVFYAFASLQNALRKPVSVDRWAISSPNLVKFNPLWLFPFEFGYLRYLATFLVVYEFE